ncbi:MAG: bifunctional hydroxymethylpyrimidine kinase/phosphomethylpyrimidine kinase [Clostridiaceae bacterium]|jgi:hydroxymethylpyrimidine/phosphomethylpyrimidine kinase|nr:bifunctional hydroxymethylpyrimidine kinase/phosphomethylpyrimidine kinase [Clostridiaceae bacterium]
MKKILTIAGSDCSGGAGIQADIKTITAHKMYAMSVITALTAQNTTGLTAILEVTPEFVGRQLDAVFTDIVPDAVKIGMVANADIIKVIAQKLRQYNAVNVVIDPVMSSTSGSRLISENAQSTLVRELFPIGKVITPNILEAEILSGIKISDTKDMQSAGLKIAREIGCAVLVKGGHSVGDATDYLCENGNITCFSGERIDNPNTHGTGCTLSSAITCGLADGKSLAKSIAGAKKYLTGALKAMLNLGSGAGPIDHMWNL